MTATRSPAFGGKSQIGQERGRTCLAKEQGANWLECHDLGRRDVFFFGGSLQLRRQSGAKKEHLRTISVRVSKPVGGKQRTRRYARKAHMRGYSAAHGQPYPCATQFAYLNWGRVSDFRSLESVSAQTADSATALRLRIGHIMIAGGTAPVIFLGRGKSRDRGSVVRGSIPSSGRLQAPLN